MMTGRVAKRLIKRYAEKGRKREIDLEYITLNKDTINKLTEFYNMESRVKKFLLMLESDKTRKLIYLIHSNYNKLAQTPASLN